jgi:hypothetical protein
MSLDFYSVFSNSIGFPLDRYAIPEILFSEMISTVGHLREERALFTPEYFQQQKMPRVLSNILSEEIQKLGQLETTSHDKRHDGGALIKPLRQATDTSQVSLSLLTPSCF